MTNEFRGYPLFNDVEDPIIRDSNRASIMFNIFEHNRVKGKLSERGTGILFGYFGQIPVEERQGLYHRFAQKIDGAGYRVRVH